MAKHSFFRSLARYRRRAFVVFTLGCMAAAAAAAYFPQAFRSEAKWMTGGQSEVASLLEIVRSRQVADRVVMELGPGCVLRGGSVQPEPVGATSADTESQIPKPKVFSDEHIAAVSRLERSLVVTASPESQIVTIACTAPSAEAAQQIVRSIGEAAIREFDRLLPAATAAMEVQEVAPLPPPQLTEGNTSIELASLQRELAVLQADQVAVEAQLQANDSESKSIEAKINSLAAIASEPAEILARQNTAAAPDNADKSGQQLAALQAHEQELTAKLHDTHPRLLTLRQQIEDLQTSLKQAPSEPVPAATSPTSGRQTAEFLAAERARAQALANQRRSLLTARERLDHQRTTIQVQIDALNKPQAQAMAAAPVLPTREPVIASPPAPRLTLIQPASYSAAPLPPSRALILSGGVLLAALGGLLAAVRAALRNPILQTPRQLETLWDLPLAGTIPPDLRVMPVAS